MSGERAQDSASDVERLRAALEEAVSVLERLPYGDWPGAMYSGKVAAANGLIRRCRATLAVPINKIGEDEKEHEGLVANTMDAVDNEPSPRLTPIALIDPLVRDNLARWIVDGWTAGAESWESTDEVTQEHAEGAAKAIIAGLTGYADDMTALPIEESAV